jgi:DNA-binding MarR family transcriptional regulator
MTKKAKLPVMSRLAKVHLTHKRRLQSALQPHGITLKQFYVLRLIERRGPQNPSVIAEELYCDRPTASVIIRNMERRDWVESQPDPESKRRRRIVLTAQGRRKISRLDRIEWHDGFDPLGDLSQKEKNQLERLLLKIQKHQQTQEGE